MALTQAKVFDTADQLVADGQNPTLANVRRALGSGSFTTISEFMTEWKAKQHVSNQPIIEAAPEAVSQRLSELGNEIWAVALSMANARLSSEREALEQQRGELEAERREAVELADAISTDLDELQTRHDAAIENIQQSNELLADRQNTNLSLAKQLESAEVRLEEHKARMNDLKAELKHAHEDINAQRKQLAEAQQVAGDSREAAARLEGELSALRS